MLLFTSVPFSFPLPWHIWNLTRNKTTYMLRIGCHNDWIFLLTKACTKLFIERLICLLWLYLVFWIAMSTHTKRWPNLFLIVLIYSLWCSKKRLSRDIKDKPTVQSHIPGSIEHPFHCITQAHTSYSHHHLYFDQKSLQTTTAVM